MLAIQNIPLVRYDANKINADVPIRSVIETYAGISVPSNPKRKINCPSPSHEDKTPSAKIYDNYCKCFSCKKKMTPITLTQEYFPTLTFPEVCEKLIKDFGLNIYEYSNLAEIEKIKAAKGKNKFYDYFPLTEDELKFIGLHNPPNKIEEKYTIKASDYYMRLFGEIPPNAETHDVNGNDILIECNRGDAIYAGLLDISKDELELGKLNQHKYFEFPKIQMLWEDDREAIEELIIAHCKDTIIKLNHAISVLQKLVNEYKVNHTTEQIQETSLIRDGYEKSLADGKNIKISWQLQDRINDLTNYEINKDMIRYLNHELDYAKSVMNKVIEHGRLRKEAQKKEKRIKQSKSDIDSR